MSSITFFFLFIPLLAFILLAVNLIFAPHNPYQEKNSAFECGFHSFLGQNRTQFSISFFIFALLFLLFDLEILLVYPYIVSAYNNSIYGLVNMLIFFLVLTLGFAFELGKKALSIDSRQTFTGVNTKDTSIRANIYKLNTPTNGRVSYLNINKRFMSHNKLISSNTTKLFQYVFLFLYKNIYIFFFIFITMDFIFTIMDFVNNIKFLINILLGVITLDYLLRMIFFDNLKNIACYLIKSSKYYNSVCDLVKGLSINQLRNLPVLTYNSVIAYFSSNWCYLSLHIVYWICFFSYQEISLLSPIFILLYSMCVLLFCLMAYLHINIDVKTRQYMCKHPLLHKVISFILLIISLSALAFFFHELYIIKIYIMSYIANMFPYNPNGQDGKNPDGSEGTNPHGSGGGNPNPTPSTYPYQTPDNERKRKSSADESPDDVPKIEVIRADPFPRRKKHVQRSDWPNPNPEYVGDIQVIKGDPIPRVKKHVQANPLPVTNPEDTQIIDVILTPPIPRRTRQANPLPPMNPTPAANTSPDTIPYPGQQMYETIQEKLHKGWNHGNNNK